MFSTIAACALAVTLVQPHSSTPAITAAPLPDVSNPSSPSNPSNHLILSLYTSFATLQALDVHSTTRAISSGAAQEANPALRGIADSPAALIAVKAATTGATIWVVEKMRKKHRSAAIAILVALNSAMSVVVAHNYSVK